MEKSRERWIEVKEKKECRFKYYALDLMTTNSNDETRECNPRIAATAIQPRMPINLPTYLRAPMPPFLPKTVQSYFGLF